MLTLERLLVLFVRLPTKRDSRAARFPRVHRVSPAEARVVWTPRTRKIVLGGTPDSDLLPDASLLGRHVGELSRLGRHKDFLVQCGPRKAAVLSGTLW